MVSAAPEKDEALTGETSAKDLEHPSIAPFLDRHNAVKAEGGAGPLETAFFSHAGRIAHKWHQYLPLYDRHFQSFRDRGTPVRMLEIGVYLGGSLELWRDYFGEDATIFGIDINPTCARFDGEKGNRVRIGSQADPTFLQGVVAEMGGLDIVLDDGSHMASHQRASFDILFPLLSQDGLYVIEDLQTAYWTRFEGGYESSTSAVALCKTLIDDMHHWYHNRGEVVAASRGNVAGLHVYDAAVFIEKKRVKAPMHSLRGKRPAAG